MNTFSKPEGPTVLVDLDNTTLDFSQRLEEIFFGRFPDVERIEKLTQHYGASYPEHAITLRGIVREKGFFRDLPLIDGALEGYQRILDAGFVPRICSAPARDHDTCREEKLDSIKRLLVPEFGAWILETTIIDRAKHAHEGVALIDDWDHAEAQKSASWQQIVMNQPYNEMLESRFRLHGWRDPNLENMLGACNEMFQSRAQAVV